MITDIHHTDRVVEPVLPGMPPPAPEAELEAAFQSGAIVVVCWEPGCSMHRLPHWPEHEWISREQVAGYRHYSHGICRWHYRMYQQEIDRFIAEDLPLARQDALSAAHGST